MENLRYMLAVVAALTLVLSVVSGANPSYFASFSAFADDDDEEEDDKRGSSNDKGEIAVAFMENGKVKLEIDDELDDDGGVTGDLEIETEDGDLADGEYAVSFSCTSPDFEEAFDESLEVDDGEGEFEAELSFANGSTYEGCEVGIGELSVLLPSFKVQAEAEEEDDNDDDDRSNSGKSRDDDEEDDDDDDNRGRGNNATSNGRDDDDDNEEERGDREVRKMKLDVEDDGIEVEVELEGLAMADGSYNAIFSCTEPRVNMTFADGFEVDDGEGEFEAEIALANGTYSGCELEVEGTTVATFGSFTVQEEESDDEVEEKRKERRKEIISNISSEIRKRINANPASTGDYEPRLNYTLVANGTADYRVHDDDDDTPTNSTGTTNSTVVQEAEVNVDIDMEVWKSNRALVLMNIFDGTIDIEGETYDVRIGYAIYSVQHDVMRVNAFVTDDAGNVMKLKLRGHAVDEDAEFPAEEGDSIELDFEGNSGGPKNRLGNAWDLTLEGKVTAD